MKMIGTLLACGACVVAAVAAERTVEPQLRSTFPIDKTKLVATGTNRYFLLQPGSRFVFTHGNVTLVRTVLGEDKWYAPGVGAIKDAEFTLVRVERPTESGH